MAKGPADSTVSLPRQQLLMHHNPVRYPVQQLLDPPTDTGLSDLCQASTRRTLLNCLVLLDVVLDMQAWPAGVQQRKGCKPYRPCPVQAGSGLVIGQHGTHDSCTSKGALRVQVCNNSAACVGSG
jgi:hypothetical protein